MHIAKKKELNEVYLLRGVASLMVCFYHLVLGNDLLFPSDYLVEKTCSYGYLGVEIFFILSGYVICYSLPENFSSRHLGTFFLKRLTRIEPPYVISIILVLLLNYLSHKITGLPNEVDLIAIASHLAYINNFIPNTYVNVVYWTLGIEAQFYVLIGLLFPFMRRTKYFLLFGLGAFIGISCIQMPGSIAVILPFLSYFTLGISLFFFKIKKQISLPLFTIITLVCFGQLFLFQGTPGTIAAIIAVLVLLFWTYVNKTIRFFSMISYSLYLIHVPVGGKIINLGMRFVGSDLSRYLLVFLALCVCIGFAYLFYRFVELPAFQLSKRIRYKTDSPINPTANDTMPSARFEEPKVVLPASTISTLQN
jgi:peptidoglycan/LPS O-acetylase OafA/YrhL